MFLVLLLAVLCALALTAYAGWRGAPWLPTPHRAVEAALDAAHVGPSDVVVDLGAGDGRVLLAAAERGARAVGYELSPFFWAIAWLRTRRLQTLVSVSLMDGFRADLSSATVIFAFLHPTTMPRLSKAIDRRRSFVNLRVVSYAFPFADRPASTVIRTPSCAPVYVYAFAPGR